MIEIYDELLHIENYIKHGFKNSTNWRKDAGLFVRWMKHDGFSKKQIEEALIKKCKKTISGFNYDIYYKDIDNIIKYNWKNDRPFIYVPQITVDYEIVKWFKQQNLKKNETKLLFTLYVWCRIYSFVFNTNTRHFNYLKSIKLLRRDSCISTNVSIRKTLQLFKEKGYIKKKGEVINITFVDDFDVFNVDVKNEIIQQSKTKDLILKTEDLYHAGDIIDKLLTSYKLCKSCNRVMDNTPYVQFCDDCAKLNKYTPKITKTVLCVDCKNGFEVSAKNNTSIRCKECYNKYRKNYKKEYDKRKR